LTSGPCGWGRYERGEYDEEARLFYTEVEGMTVQMGERKNRIKELGAVIRFSQPERAPAFEISHHVILALVCWRLVITASIRECLSHPQPCRCDLNVRTPHGSKKDAIRVQTHPE